ncbi:MAG: metallophosphoesterase [Bacteroidales bacterium]|nr:metallophosphoesterase [Bacteroidales bacterium]
MKIGYILAPVALVFAQLVSAQTLTIVHFNDSHSQIEASREYGSVGHSGIVEQSIIVDSIFRADGRKNVLLLHAGDFSQGSSYFKVFKGDMEVKVMNLLDFDVTALGNHEFDNGVDELARRLKDLKCPVVCANYDFSATSLGKLVKPYTIVRKAHSKIGIIGIITDLTTVVDEGNSGSMKLLDTVQEVNKYAEILKKKKGCDLVICLSHCGFEKDVMYAQRYENVDLVVGGHSHTFMTEPTVVESADGKMIPIVQAGCYLMQAGVMKVRF